MASWMFCLYRTWFGISLLQDRDHPIERGDDSLVQSRYQNFFHRFIHEPFYGGKCHYSNIHPVKSIEFALGLFHFVSAATSEDYQRYLGYMNAHKDALLGDELGRLETCHKMGGNGPGWCASLFLSVLALEIQARENNQVPIFGFGNLDDMDSHILSYSAFSSFMHDSSPTRGYCILT